MPAKKSELPSPESSPGVRVEVGGKMIAGTILSTAHRVLRLGFETGALREVAVGDPIVLELGGAQGQPLELNGLVKLWRQGEEEDQLRVEIAAEDVDIVEEAFRRQRATRIGIHGERAVRVTVEAPKAKVAVQAALLNISEKGLGLLVRFDDDRALAEGQKKTSGSETWALNMTLQLPGNDEELQLVCRVVYRSLSAKCVKYGVQIDEELTAKSFPASAERISEHMMLYQQSLLQSRAA